jgi:hypothetical protein
MLVLAALSLSIVNLLYSVYILLALLQYGYSDALLLFVLAGAGCGVWQQQAAL